LAAFGATKALGQGGAEVRGRVLAESGLPIPGAQIELRPGTRRVVSATDGRFRFVGVEPGRHELHVKRIGYQPAVVELAVVTDTAVTVRLPAIPRVLDSVRIRERARELRFLAVVVDDLGLPVPDAEFVAEGIDNKLRTDGAGRVVLAQARRGTLMVRIRRVGYEVYFGTFLIEGEREDTLRMKRLPRSLTDVEIRARSGFGRDTFVFAELHSRQSWKSNVAGVIGREELSALGDANLCSALPLTRTGARLRLRPDGSFCRLPACVLLNGDRPGLRMLSSFRASEVEAVEYFPANSDWSGTIASRAGMTCYPRMLPNRGPGRHPGGWVLWLRPK
jgi:hypothetical protein